MKADQERVSNLLTDTVTLLCRNGLQYKTEMKVQGLLGITLDDEVFLVQIDKKFGDLIGADLMALQQEGDLENHENQHQDQSGDDTSEGRTSPSGRKRNRIKRKRKKSDSANSDPDSPSAKVSNILVKSEPCQEEEDDEDDLVMIESDDKVGLHDKDTMRESYGVSYNNDLAQSESNADLLQNMAPVGQSNSSFLTSYNNDGSRLLDQAGCSAWDDPLSALTDPSNSVAPQGGSSSGGDDTMDQQTMSTGEMYDGSNAWYSADFKRGKSPYKFVCPELSCGKRFNYKQNLLRHQTIKHGRVPIKPVTPIWQLDLPPEVGLSNMQKISMLQFPQHNDSTVGVADHTQNSTSTHTESSSAPIDAGEDAHAATTHAEHDTEMKTDNLSQRSNREEDLGNLANNVAPEAEERGPHSSEDRELGDNLSTSYGPAPSDRNDAFDIHAEPGITEKHRCQTAASPNRSKNQPKPQLDDYGDLLDIKPDFSGQTHPLLTIERMSESLGMNSQDTTTTVGIWEARTTSVAYPHEGSFDAHRTQSNVSWAGQQYGPAGMATDPSGYIYKCSMCDKIYNLKHNLQRHQNTKHGRVPKPVGATPWM